MDGAATAMEWHCGREAGVAVGEVAGGGELSRKREERRHTVKRKAEPSRFSSPRPSHDTMKLVALTLVLALGASSMAKSALNSSSPPTFHLGSSGGPVGAERRALVACTLPRFAAVALCCRPPLISPCFDVRWSLRRGGRGPRQAAAPEEADPARRAVLFGQAVQHHAAGVEPGAGQRVQRGGD